MELYQAKLLATSLAGHDKGKCYVVLRQDNDGYYLVDGTNKLLARPKKKNQKHVQLIKHLPEELTEPMENIREDADVRKILKLYDDTRNISG